MGNFFVVRKYDKITLLTPSLSFLNSIFYEEIHGFSDGFAAVKRDGLWGYIDGRGNTISECIFESAGDFENGKAAIVYRGYTGYIYPSGRFEYFTPADYIRR